MSGQGCWPMVRPALPRPAVPAWPSFDDYARNLAIGGDGMGTAERYGAEQAWKHLEAHFRGVTPAPAVPEGAEVWVLYDATADRKYIKKNIGDGCLAVFDYEHEAIDASGRHPGTAYKKMMLATAPAVHEADGCTCQGCGVRYRSDLMVPDEIWEQIKPDGKPEGAGLLCPTCIMDRITGKGIWSAGYATAEESLTTEQHGNMPRMTPEQVSARAKEFARRCTTAAADAEQSEPALTASHCVTCAGTGSGESFEDCADCEGSGVGPAPAKEVVALNGGVTTTEHLARAEQPEDGPVAVTVTMDGEKVADGSVRAVMSPSAFRSVPPGTNLYTETAFRSVKAERDALREQVSDLEREREGLYAAVARLESKSLKLRERVKELEADAARYRWLRDGNDTKGSEAFRIATRCYGLGWDEAIDAAMQEGKS